MRPETRVPDRLEPRRSALVVIDIQERFRDLIHRMDEVVAGTKRLIEFGQQLDIPILVTEHYPRGLGETLGELRLLCDGFDPIEKIHFSCCGDEGFRRRLAALRRDQVILCGIEAHVCVYQTACDLLRDGKQVAVAVDAVSSCRSVDREIGLRRMAEVGAQNMGVQMLMFELLVKAGTDQFKAVSNLLKY